MLAQRTMQNTLRRTVVQRNPLSRNTLPAAVTRSQARFVASSGDHVFGSTGEAAAVKPVAGGASEELIQQRLRRPVAPHLSIYQPQITWYGSITHRITGSVLSGAFYVFGFGYLVQPMFGLHLFESPSMVAGFAGLSAISKFLIKFGFALPFTYHGLNGLRHLAWDAGKQLTNKQVQVTGWTVIGASTALAGYLAMLGGA